MPYDIKAAANAAKLGQTFADANRTAKAGVAMRDIAKAVHGRRRRRSDDEQAKAKKSLLGKIDLKGMLSKKGKPLPAGPRPELNVKPAPAPAHARSTRKAGKPDEHRSAPADRRGPDGRMVLGYLAFAGPSPAKESARRLQAVRYRHSESTTDKVEAQLRKAVAARKPKMHQIAGSESRIAALALRLHRTGKGWTLSQYLYASLGSTGRIVADLSSSQARRWRWASACWSGAACRTWWSTSSSSAAASFHHEVSRCDRTAGARPALRPAHHRNAGRGRAEVPGPVGEEFKLVTERIKIGKTMEDALQETADRLGTRRIQLLLHHAGDPARNRRQPGRNAVQPGRRAAQARTDEAQDPRR
jgi:hypothetical protein